MIEKNAFVRDSGERLLEQMSARQVEILHEIEELRYDGRLYDADELDTEYLAYIAEVTDLFRTNDNGHLLDPRYRTPMSDLREVADLDNPPDNAGSIYNDELEALV